MYIADQQRRLVHGYRPYIKRHNYPQVRCSFWVLAWANGCFYDCTYCWLKAYHGPRLWNEILIAEKSALARKIKNFCRKIGGSQLLNAGELCDSFVAPEYIPFMAETLRQANAEYGRCHRLLLLTKSADPLVLLQGDFQDVVLYSVSVNTETIAKQFERGAPSPSRRIHAAWRLKEAGYEVRIRVDPIIAGSNPPCGFKSRQNSNPAWNTVPAYMRLMERICCLVEPALITLGCLRATPRTYRALPPAIRSQLSEKTPWGYGYPSQTRLTIYNELIDVARRHGVSVALCKEPDEVWKRLGLKGPCNCMPMRG